MPTPPPDRLRMTAEPASVPRLRDAARRWATDAGLDPEQVGDVALAVSEAATNAVLHAFIGRDPGTVTLAMEPDDGHAVFRISDDGRGLTPRIDSPGLGLGLSTIGRLADHVDVGASDEGGTEVRMIFAAPQLASGTALRRRLEAAYGTLTDAITVNTADGRMVYANAAAVALMGASRTEELTAREAGATAAEFRITLPDGSPVRLDDLPHRRLLAGEPDPPALLTRSVHLPSGRARWLLTTAAPLDGDELRGRLALNVIRDVTESTNAERRAAFLAETGDRLSHAAVDLERTFTEIAQQAVPDLADWCAVDIADDDGVLRRVALAHADPVKAALGREIHERWPPGPEQQDGPYGVLRSGRSRVLREVGLDVLDTIADAEHRAAVRALGMRSIVLVPLVGRAEPVGVMSFVMADSARTFDDDAVAFAAEVGRRAGLAVDNARRMRPR